MERNIIITGGAGNLGKAVVQKFKREGYKVIATVLPDSEDSVEDADDTYHVDVSDESSVRDFAAEYNSQYGELDALALLVGGFAMGTIEETSQTDIEKMTQLNFFSAYNMVRFFLPLMKKADAGTFLLVGARPALEPTAGKTAVAYSLSKGLVIELASLIAEETKESRIRVHVFVPSIIDTEPNRKAMPNADFSKWVSPAEIAETMHFATNNPAIRNTTFKLYGGV